MSSDGTIGVNVVATVRVDESLLDSSMSDDELRSEILKHGDAGSVEALAQSLGPVREQLGGNDE